MLTVNSDRGKIFLLLFVSFRTEWTEAALKFGKMALENKNENIGCSLAAFP